MLACTFINLSSSTPVLPLFFSTLHRKYPRPPFFFLLPFNVSPWSPPSFYYADSDSFLFPPPTPFCSLFHPGRTVLILTIHTVRWEGNYPDQNFLVLRSNNFQQGRPIRRITERGDPGESAERQKGGGAAIFEVQGRKSWTGPSGGTLEWPTVWKCLLKLFFK